LLVSSKKWKFVSKTELKISRENEVENDEKMKMKKVGKKKIRERKVYY